MVSDASLRAILFAEDPPKSNRKTQREALQSTWTVLEPRVPGRPFRTKDIEDSAEIAATEQRFAQAAEVFAQDARPAQSISRRTYLPALARAANHVDKEAAQVPMPK